jgi:hypothetical protein
MATSFDVWALRIVSGIVEQNTGVPEGEKDGVRTVHLFTQ